MQHKQNIVKAILLKENFDGRDEIRNALLPLFEASDISMTSKLSVALLLASEKKNYSLSEALENVKKNFSNVVAILEEHDVKLPEEECALEAAVKKIYEEGEGGGGEVVSDTPANVTANIDPSTPRIYPKKKKDESDT